MRSNVVTAIVAALEGVSLESDRSLQAAPGTRVVFQHVLSNTGNARTEYILSYSNLGGDDFDVSGLSLYRDVNGDGSVDPGDIQIASGGSINLDSGTSAQLLLVADATGSRAGAVARLELSASTTLQHLSKTNVDTLTLKSGTVQLTKSVDTSTPARNEEVTFTLTSANRLGSALSGIRVTVDGVSVQRVIIRDVIPANTRFSGIESSAGLVPLFHLWGSSKHEYVSNPPADSSQVDAIAFAASAVAADANIEARFKVKISATASGDIFNTAKLFFTDGTADTELDSNTVRLAVPEAAPDLNYYADASYTRSARMSRIGLPLFVQANAAACNLDPLSVERKPIRLSSSRTGDIESFVADETGPNTGVFRILPNVSTRDASSGAVSSGNAILDVLHDDQVIATLEGCGASVSAIIVMDPAGVIFDSRSNDPIGGATVTLVDVTGDGNGGRPGQPANVFEPDGVTAAPNSVTTAADGRFLFPFVHPSTYRIDVTPTRQYVFPSKVALAELPVGRRVDANASFARVFQSGQDGSPVAFDIPGDQVAVSGLFTEKVALKTMVEVGDFVDFKVTIKNNTGVVLRDLWVEDRLPFGFTYVLGSARVDNTPVANPDGGYGPVLRFHVGTVPDAGATLSYRLQVGPTAGQGDGVNTAEAISGSTHSNKATAKVKISTTGMFSERGYVVGKVFLDCNANGFQNAGDVGMPGVRLYLEDGSFVITDEFGRFSFYGLQPRTHVLKLDRSSLPGSAFLVTRNVKSAMDGASRFVDLKVGELQNADFAVAGCPNSLLNEATARRAKLKPNAEIEESLRTPFALERNTEMERPPTAMASGFVGNGAAAYVGAGAPPLAQPTASGGPKVAATSVAPRGAVNETSATDRRNSSATSAPQKSEAEKADDEFLASLDNKLAFVDLTDGSTLSRRKSNVRVKAPGGSTFKLYVNGKEVSTAQVGMRSEVPQKQSTIWTYVGVDFAVGQNQVRAEQFDPFGNKRGEVSLRVFTPDRVGKLLISPADGRFVADGKTPAKVRIRVTDATGIQISGRTHVTITTTLGEIRTKDLNSNEPGVQTVVEDGNAEFEMMPPLQPGTAKVKVSNGEVEGTALITFTPEMRPMMAAGLVEVALNFNSSGSGIEPVGAADAFEQQLRLFSARSEDGSVQFGSHGALMLKGKVKGETLLTMAYDSAKVTRERLFRDIQPDEYYPVYGDASIRGFDAQTAGKAYLRLDHGKSYVMFGDYDTAESNATQTLGNYMRTLNGVRQHWENRRFTFNTFATRDTYRQVVVEIPANGTSGPYQLPNSNGLANSEKVEIIIRDRNQPAVIVKSSPQTRFADYEFEPFTGRLLFKSFIPMLDESMNPVWIRVTYEVDQGGEKFWVAGVSSSTVINERLQVGGNLVVDRNPQDERTLASFNSRFKLAEKTMLIGEVAQTDRSAAGAGYAYRFEMQRDAGRLKGRAWYGHTDVAFDNPSSILNRGRGEAGAKLTMDVTGNTQLLGEFLRTEDVATGAVMNGGEMGVASTYKGKIRSELSYRFSREDRPANQSSVGITPNEINAIDAKVYMPVPHLESAEVSGEFGQDLLVGDRRIASLGGSYTFRRKTKAYVRHEFVSSIGSTYSLNSQQSRNATMFGVESSYLKNTNAFSEYRVRNTINTPEAEAAVGVRNSWQVKKGLAFTSGLESIRTVRGRDNDSIAITGGVDYTGSQRWRGSSRLEWRGNSSGSGWLSTIGAAAKLSEEWTVLGRNVLSINKNAGDHARLQDRMQFGGAYRGIASPWNALAMLELRRDSDDTSVENLLDRKATIASITANYRATQAIELTGRYAIKFSLENSLGIRSTGRAQVASGRVTYQFAKRWDIGLVGNTLMGASSRQFGTGAELGFLLTKNLWVSSGYNVTGHNIDMGGDDVTRRGGFVRFRFKFDENIFRSGAKEK